MKIEKLPYQPTIVFDRKNVETQQIRVRISMLETKINELIDAFNSFEKITVLDGYMKMCEKCTQIPATVCSCCVPKPKESSIDDCAECKADYDSRPERWWEDKEWIKKMKEKGIFSSRNKEWIERLELESKDSSSKLIDKNIKYFFKNHPEAFLTLNEEQKSFLEECVRSKKKEEKQPEAPLINEWSGKLEIKQPEILPCPFCAERFIRLNDFHMDGKTWHINCDKCSATLSEFETKQEAIDAWNKRA